MKRVCETDRCTGCMACLDSCGKHAISINDSLRTYNAVIDEDKCVSCGACHRVCQNNHPIAANSPLSWYQGWAKDETVRSHSSSGGFATGLAKHFIEKMGGTVCSCAFRGGEFVFDVCDDASELHKFVGSKYVKSNPVGIYKRIRKMLASGTPVLFIGLPCQAAAVKLFVGERHSENLYLVDLICHGTPSPQHLGRFLSEKGYDIASLANIGFRQKGTFRVTQNRSYVEIPGVYDCYTLAFLNGVNYTENCYHCQYAKRERVADITIGDSWGSLLPQEEQRKGISLALCQTEKGERLLHSADFELHPVDLETAIQHNHQLERPSIKPKTYDAFFEALASGNSYAKAVRTALPRTYFNQKIKKLFIRLKILNGGGKYILYISE